MIASPAAPTASVLPNLVQAVLSACDAYHADPKSAEALKRLGPARRDLARAVVELPNTARQQLEALGIQGVIETLMKTGILDQAIGPEEQDLLSSWNPRAWSGIVASMIIAPAWEWRAAPSLDDVPNWLWSLFTRYIFHVPQSFTAPGQAEKYSDHHLRRLTELERWVSFNKGSAVVRDALVVYLEQCNCIPLYFSTSSLKRHYELRARILAIATQVGRQMDIAPFPREGRRLRIGFVKMHWGPQTETYSTMPTFEKADKERFEICLYTVQESGSDVEKYLRGVASEFNVLPSSVEDRLLMLQGANLDVLVFATNVTAVTNDILLLAQYRIAPLQVMHHPSCTTTGLPEMDLYVSGELTESAASPAHFTERLGLMPGPSHAFNYEVDRQEPGAVPTRADLGIPDDAFLFVSAANYFKIIPEMMHLWAKLLKSVPGSRLLVHPFNPNWSSSYPIERFCGEFDRVLEENGVSSDRLLVSTFKFPSRSDVKELLRLGNAYLDTFPFSGVNSLIDPLECGIPTLVWEGETFRARMASALLHQMGLEDLIVHSEEKYLELGARLAADGDWRSALSQRINTSMETVPIFMDPLAASDAFGGLMEAAYDELVSVGREEFRKRRQPVRVTAPDLGSALEDAESSLQIGLLDEAWSKTVPLLGAYPDHRGVRRLAGRILTQKGVGERASDYLLASIQSGEVTVEHWLDLGNALFFAGKYTHAVEVVQICLRQDPRCKDAILLLGEIAERGGILDQIGDAVALAQEIDPTDLRVVTLAAKVAQAKAGSFTV